MTVTLISIVLAAADANIVDMPRYEQYVDGIIVQERDTEGNQTIGFATDKFGASFQMSACKYAAVGH